MSGASVRRGASRQYLYLSEGGRILGQT